MKTSILRYFSYVTVVGLIASACSTQKDKFVNRKFHSVTTKYNVLYNGNLALDAGLEELKVTYNDNFWDILPIERMQITEPVFGQDSVPRNANFKRAEDKAIKAVEKHSMNIGGSEKNPQMDEVYLLLGKSRYYDQRFIPALEAFNFILHKYPDSDRINELKIWKEKVNIRLDNNNVAIQNLSKLLKEIKFKDQVTADANAILAQAYLNEKQHDSAIACLKRAKEYTEIKEEKARYTFILGQLLMLQNQNEDAYASFQEVIDMNRRSPRQYVIQAQVNQAKLSLADLDSVTFTKKFNKLLKDRENRPYLDVLNHQVALYYDKKNNKKEAIKYYNLSLKNKSKDAYMVASNYRNLGELYFYSAKYTLAGKYYDSTLVNLDNRTREHRSIKRKRENLEDVIKYEAIAVNHDSILNLVRMNDTQRKDFFTAYIEKLKEQEKNERLLAEKIVDNPVVDAQPEGRPSKRDVLSEVSDEEVFSKSKVSRSQTQNMPSSPGMPPSTSPVASNFYFYNQSAVNQGKSEFRKKWGSRPLRDYWRLANYQEGATISTEEGSEGEEGGIAAKDKNFVEPRFTTEFYINQIPTDQAEIDNLQKERNFAYYQLGIIYKDKFSEYQMAQEKLEGLLASNPEERLILPSMYNLYKIYETLGISDKMASMKSAIMAKYPDSRYAQIINNPSSINALTGTPDQVYKSMYELFEDAKYKELLTEIEPLIEQYSGEDIISKLELLKANAIGNLRGLNAYKEALNYVALTYPNSIEGKEAESLLSTNISKLDKMKFGNPSESFKIIHKTSPNTDLKELYAQLDKFLKDRPQEKFKITFDGYTETENFVTIHHIESLQKAKDIIVILEEYKDYKIKETFIPISSEDYKVVQIKKNFEEYLRTIQTTP